jgi:hypothetical protein
MRDIVTADILGPGGKLNAKNAEVALKAIEMAHVRVFGAPIIRTKNETVSVNLNQTQNLPPPKNVDELKQELEMLKNSQQAQIQSANVIETVAVKGMPDGVAVLVGEKNVVTITGDLTFKSGMRSR